MQTHWQSPYRAEVISHCLASYLHPLQRLTSLKMANSKWNLFRNEVKNLVKISCSNFLLSVYLDFSSTGMLGKIFVPKICYNCQPKRHSRHCFDVNSIHINIYYIFKMCKYGIINMGAHPQGMPRAQVVFKMALTNLPKKLPSVKLWALRKVLFPLLIINLRKLSSILHLTLSQLC